MCKRLLLSGGLLALLMGLLGCATTYRFKVDALAAPEAAGATRFVLQDPVEPKPGSRLRYREAADYVRRALLSHGWEEVASADETEMVISLRATVSEPLNDTERRMEPVYYRTWGQSRFIRTPVVNDKGDIRYVTTRVYIPPATHFAGYQDYDRNVVVYRKTLELTGQTPEGEDLWTLEVSTIDEDSDLRAYIPLLAAAALPYIGESTEGAIGVSLHEDDESVVYLRGRSASDS